MNGLLLVVTSISGMLAFAFFLLAFMSLTAIDAAERAEINEAARRFFPGDGFFAQLNRRGYIQSEAGSASRMGDHWRARPQIRTFLSLGAGFLLIAVICGHFAALP
jgi:hypothetical protein